MIMFVLSNMNVDFDYLVGSSINGFELSVKISDAPLIIIEGDEYLSSPLDLRSKFLWYNPHISIITAEEKKCHFCVLIFKVMANQMEIL